MECVDRAKLLEQFMYDVKEIKPSATVSETYKISQGHSRGKLFPQNYKSSPVQKFTIHQKFQLTMIALDAALLVSISRILASHWKSSVQNANVKAI